MFVVINQPLEHS